MTMARTAAIVSFRFGATDGVSVEARKWAWALAELGVAVRWVAGAGEAVDVRVAGLEIGARGAPSMRDVGDAIDGCDVVVVENLLSLPLNVPALETVATALRGRAAIVHHHDLPWQRPQFAASPPPPTDHRWAHVTINELSRGQLAARGIEATTIYNRFAVPERVGVEAPAAERPLLLHPTRAIPRKNVPAAIRLAEGVGGTYWLLGPAEDGYGDELDALVRAATCPVIREGDIPIGDAYAACDLVVYPSTWEGFGNPTIESALARRPLAVGDYPVLDELRAFGFRWFHHEEVAAIRRFLLDPDVTVLDHNEAVAKENFLLAGLPDALRGVLERVL